MMNTPRVPDMMRFHPILVGKSDQDMVSLAKRAIARIAEPIALCDSRKARIEASAGVAIFPLGGQPERASDVFDRADRALYRSKAQGGNQAQAEPQLDSRNASA